MTMPHRCDDECVCPIHGTPLVYWPAGDDHACQDASCVYRSGVYKEHLRLLDAFVRPLSADEQGQRSQLYREAGTLTRETIVHVLLGEFS